MIWNQAYGGSSSDQGYCVVESSLGNLLLMGESSSLPDFVHKNSPVLGGKDYWFLFLTQNGVKLWDETLGGSSDEGAKYIMKAHDYGFILAGISNSDIYPPYKSDDARGNSTNDLWVVRTGCAFPGPELEDVPKTCLDDEIQVDATVPAPCVGCNYFWDDGGTGPFRSFSPDSTVEVKVTVVHPDGCEMSDSVTIVIIPGPDNLEADGDPISCYGANDASYFVESVSGIAPPFQFSLNGGAWEPSANYFDMAPGTYLLEVLDTNGCRLDTSFYIDQKEQVLVELGPDIFLDYGDSVQLQALTNLVDSFSFEWGQPSLVSCTYCLEPWVHPATTTTFNIVLKDKDGCKAEDLVRVILQKSNDVYIPNSFSPNLDNINDFFTVYADRTVQRVKSLQIFDRWGELMFERFDFQPNKGTLGWDGKFNGRSLDPAVFVYWVEVAYFDGRTELFKGEVVLMH
ncbi:MAG: gliding motility-associated C-terminal domain-containing protein [Saprospiraceae bacterium]|nr:gliding motility-associated C-terminal domain-containing protein [Saprospiraceae bacterium]